MNFLLKITVLTCFICFSSVFAFAQTAKYKCLVQMNTYKGLEAYIVVSLINPQGKYEKTLYVMGNDAQWYNGFKEWYKHLGEKKEKLHAITGASVAAGSRSSVAITLDESKLNQGYKLRFESVVEDQNYHATDVEIPMNTEALTQKTVGAGYIRFVKLTKVN